MFVVCKKFTVIRQENASVLVGAGERCARVEKAEAAGKLDGG